MEEAEKYNKICLQRKGKLKMGAASPSPGPKKKKAKTAPRVVKEETDSPDLQVSAGDAIGQMVL